MALIRCPECKKKVSDQCEVCPKCGYPFKINIDDLEFSVISENPSPNNNTFKKSFHRVWMWSLTCIISLSLGLVFFLFCIQTTKPKIDENGNPIFVELTNEVYANAKKYKGYHINIKGKVFQVIEGTGTSKGIHVWLDPETCEQNMMIYCNSDADVKQGDYISCSGYIDSITEYKNAYNAELQAPLVYSSDLTKATYIDVMAPTTNSITPGFLRKEARGYAVSISKVEFSEKETRVYVSVRNYGNSPLYIGDSVIVQDGKQYEPTTNYEANYATLPYEVVKGASSEGIIVFPAMDVKDFEFSIKLHSDDLEKEREEYVFLLGPEKWKIKLSRNELALARAEKLGHEWTAITRDWLTEALQSWDSFSENEARYAVAHANIDWNTHAMEYIEEYAKTHIEASDWVTREQLWNILTGMRSFTESEASYAVANAIIDWKAVATNYANGYQDSDYPISPSDLADYLSERGFKQEEIQYAIENCSIDWNRFACNLMIEKIAYYNRKSWYDKAKDKDYLIDLVVSYGFTLEQARYAANTIDNDWT